MIPRRMTVLAIAAVAFAAFQFAPLAHAQVQATLRSAQGLPPGQLLASATPGGSVVLGADLYIGDGVQGLRHFIPADPSNPNPINTGILIFDTDQFHSVGGGGLCLPFCQVGQIAYDGNQNVYVAIYDHQKGGPATTFPGIWRFAPPSALTGGEWTTNTLLAPRFGLAGNQPTAIALGPDGNLYVGFLKNGNVVRITDPTADPSSPTQVVQSVGTSPNGRNIRALTFVGNDLYMGTTDALAVIRNATAKTCLGGCNGVAIPDGFSGQVHVGLTTDGINRIYMAINGRGVYRYTVSSGTTSVVSTGGLDAANAPATFAFVGGHTNLLQLDRLGNLWIGDDTSDGAFNNAGRLWYISAGTLSNLPNLP